MKRLCYKLYAEGLESKGMLVEVRGLEVEDYDVLSENLSTRVVSFNARNNYFNASTNISVSTESNSFSKIGAINKDGFIMVFTEVNYSTDDTKTFNISLNGGGSLQKLKSISTKVQGATIENYSKVDNGTQRHYTFYVRNNWKSGNFTPG